MAEIRVHTDESIEKVLKRFKKAVEREGIMRDFKRKRFYVKPSVQKRMKQKKARRRMLRKKTGKPRRYISRPSLISLHQ